MSRRTVEIKSTELAALRQKAQAHDDYLAAIRIVETKYATIWGAPNYSEPFISGYAAAINDLAQAVADAVGFRLAEAHMVGQAGASQLFDRAVPEMRLPRS